ncbi:orotate phosphoribosyltransferase [Dyadobacter jejuensis]|uniref:Orotate phosphoribosyltransferase n=1 Tax=Dyadobacter jejuensis TaxID=1082580 RepID=A0A316AGJ7_9BACT|nr:orotate phosphoribosyltransferase [Dyadobacter jejuensis]PWJ56741.1 orotate phosphoribosyltransferase [Dyadobacter jejuensis]
MEMEKEVSSKVAALLLQAQAIKLSPENPFVWSSGWNSPIYCDNRVALSYPETRDYLKQKLSDIVREQYPNVDTIVGVATGGIAMGALVADVLNLPFAYVRPEPKKHGMGNQIEGRIETGQSVLVVEDLISTGGSSLKVVDALRAQGIEVAGMVAIFTYGFAVAAEQFAAKNVSLTVLSNYSALMEEAVSQGRITQQQEAYLSEWRLQPSTWGKK